MAFHDVLFPASIARGASCGPRRKTDIITFGSGREQRNAKWANSRRQYNAAYGIKTLDDLHELVAFFEARRGRLHAFRFRDPLDHKSCRPSLAITALDQLLGMGDGERTVFDLVKLYGTGETAITRRIHKPRVSSLRVAIDGVELAKSAFSWDATQDRLKFKANAIPIPGAAITAGFEFDVPVRFDSDEIHTSLSHFEAGEIPSIPLVEVQP